MRNALRRPARHRVAPRLISLAACLGTLACLAPAQPAPPSAQTPEQRLAAPVAESVERLAMLDLRLRGRAIPDDYRLTARILEAARDLDPNNADLNRRIAAAAFSAGDEASVLDATRRIIRLDPRDTVAQLRLITAIVNREQTAEARLNAYDRYLSTDRIDPAVRSHLALDAALLSRELGDNPAFLERLGQATSLDVSNKDAAALALRTAEERSPPPDELLEYQVNLLYADPVDPNVLRALAQSLASQGAYPQARRMLASSVKVSSAIGQPPSDLLVESMSLDAIDLGPRPVLNELEAARLRIVHGAEQQRDQAEAAGQPESEWPDPDEARLPIPFERLRLMLAFALGDEETTRASLDDLEASLTAAIEDLSKRAEEAGVSNAPEVQGRYLELFLTIQTARAITGLDLNRLTNEVNRAVERVPNLAIARNALTPWLALHDGDPARALELASDPDLQIQLARGAALAQLGRTDEAVDAFLSVIRDAPYEPTSVWAALRVIDMAGESALTTSTGTRMGEFIDRIPTWMDRMIDDPSRYEALTLTAPRDSVSDAEYARVTVTLRNMAPIPLGVGADRPISSRFMLTPSLDESVRGFVGTPQPEVVELDRRLRLEPREAIEADLKADSPYTSWLLALNAKLTIRQRWRLLQSFQIGRLGAIVSGPLALTAETGAVRRYSLPEARLTPEELTYRVQQDDPLTFPRTLVGIRAGLLGPDAAAAAENADALDRLVTALAARFDRAGPVERSLMLAELPHGRMVPAFSVFDQHAVERLAGSSVREDDELVAILTLMTRVVDPASPAFDAAINSGLPRLADAAAMLRARLTDKRPAYARVGANADDMGGPIPTNKRPAPAP